MPLPPLIELELRGKTSMAAFTRRGDWYPNLRSDVRGQVNDPQVGICFFALNSDISGHRAQIQVPL